jgi:hypothetical protein
MRMLQKFKPPENFAKFVQELQERVIWEEDRTKSWKGTFGRALEDGLDWEPTPHVHMGVHTDAYRLQSCKYYPRELTKWSGKFIPWAKEAFARDMGSGMPLKCEPDDPANVAKRKLENHRGLLPDVTNSLYRNSYVDHKGGMKIPDGPRRAHTAPVGSLRDHNAAADELRPGTVSQQGSKRFTHVQKANQNVARAAIRNKAWLAYIPTEVAREQYVLEGTGAGRPPPRNAGWAHAGPPAGSFAPNRENRLRLHHLHHMDSRGNLKRGPLSRVGTYEFQIPCDKLTANGQKKPKQVLLR